MSQIKKLYDKLNRRPTPSDIRFCEVDRLLRYFGFERRQSSRGSHNIYTHTELDDFQASIPKKDPVKEPYVINAIDAIKRIIELKEGDEYSGE